jgi:hypothetical protein
MRAGILLVCPASFLGDKGVSNSLPLDTIDALNAVQKREKDGRTSILEYTRLTKNLDKSQLENNMARFGVFVTIQKWRPLLHALVKRDNFVQNIDLAGQSSWIKVSPCP